MENSNAQKIRLGLFVIIGTLLFVIAIYLIGQKQNMFQSNFTISAYFQNIKGLQAGNNVRYSGIIIGTVKNISMLNDSTIKVAMLIDKKIISHIKKNAIATISSDGLVGSMIVNIVPGKGKAPGIKNGDIIESYSKMGADDILSTLSTTNDNVALVIADILKVTNAMTDSKGTLGMLLNDTVMAKDLKRSIYNLKLATQNTTKIINELNTIVGNAKTNTKTVLGVALNDTIAGNRLKSVINNLEASSVAIKDALENINTLTTDINNSKGAYNYLVKDSAMVKDLKSIMKNIDEGTDKFNQNMEALKHNFLTRGYFRKLEREEKKKGKQP